MPDTTNRPTPIIPGIMGWEPTPEEWGYIGAFNHPAGGYVITDDRQVTPDDMLAWLREQSYDVDVTGRRTHLAGDYLAGRGHVTVMLTAFRCDPESYTAPTLHAALEAAVIAVGRAE